MYLSASAVALFIGIARYLCWGGLTTEAPKAPRSRGEGNLVGL